MNNYFLKGGSLRVNELKLFLEASYNKDAPKQLLGYTLDEKLSNLYGKVYFNNDLKKVVVAFRGTVENSDWTNNAIYATNSSAYKLTPRFKEGQKMANKVVKNYKGFQIEHIGHSQGALLAHLTNSKDVKNVIQLNPAYKDESLSNNEYIVRSSNDVVSALSVPKKMLNDLLYPNWTKKHMKIIPAKSTNPLVEHSIDILDRLDPNMVIGKGSGKNLKIKRKLDKYIINI
jgi:hypothetical protein